MGYSPDGIALRRVYNKCRVTLGTVYRNLGRAKRSADPKVDVSAESARASAMFHSSLDYTMCGASGASSLERSVALNGIATYLYEQEGFEEALRCYGDALALQRCVVV